MYMLRNTLPIINYLHHYNAIPIQLAYIFLFNQKLHTKIAIAPRRDDKWSH